WTQGLGMELTVVDWISIYRVMHQSNFNTINTFISCKLSTKSQFLSRTCDKLIIYQLLSTRLFFHTTITLAYKHLTTPYYKFTSVLVNYIVRQIQHKFTQDVYSKCSIFTLVSRSILFTKTTTSFNRTSIPTRSRTKLVISQSTVNL